MRLRQAQPVGEAGEELSKDEGAATLSATPGLTWAPEAEREIHKIPFFVRGKARRNTERFAVLNGLSLVTVETLYDAKAHFGR